MKNGASTVARMQGSRMRPIDLWWSAGGFLIAGGKALAAGGSTRWVCARRGGVFLGRLLGAFFLVGLALVVAGLIRHANGSKHHENRGQR